MATAATVPGSSASRILTRAMLRAGRAMGMRQKDLAASLGVSEATVSRLARGRSIDPETKEGELAVLLVRTYRSLDTLVGGDDARARAWMQAPNTHLNGTPAELIRSIHGLIRVVEYLDALRGKS
jgi:transcriptional regulator with XRE-family HTH domain